MKRRFYFLSSYIIVLEIKLMENDRETVLFIAQQKWFRGRRRWKIVLIWGKPQKALIKRRSDTKFNETVCLLFLGFYHINFILF